MNIFDELLSQLPEPMLDEFYERHGNEDSREIIADLAGDYISQLWIANRELLEALEIADEHRGMFPAWVAEKITDAIAKAKS